MVEAALAPGTRVLLKLELLQCTGSFKARGALINVLRLGPDERRRGVCAVSAGNHAIATAYAASCLGISARVVMPASANPLRIARCRLYGAEVELAPDIHAAFRRLEEIQAADGRSLIHPFEGPEVALGTGTLGLEWLEQAPDLEAVIVPIGGGGLAAGLSAAIKLLKPGCEVIGVEPFGADSWGAPAVSASLPWKPWTSWITCWRTRLRSAPSLTRTWAATPSPSRTRPSRMSSVPM